MRFSVGLQFIFVGILGQNREISSLSDQWPEDRRGGWTSFDYPDIRAKPWTDQCGKNVPFMGYVCDPSPEPMIGKSEAQHLNQILIDLAKTTQCHCQRKSQCLTKFLDNPITQVKVGFIASVAFVHKLNYSYGSVHQAVEKFAKLVRKRWGLGDCGNSALIVIWKEHHMMHISTDEEVTRDFVTDREVNRLVESVRALMLRGEYLQALDRVLNGIRAELDGERKKRVDMGTVALLLSSGVAAIVVVVITACVCAFRCCGNLRNAPLKEVIERVETLRNELERDRLTKTIGLKYGGNGFESHLHIRDESPIPFDTGHSLV